MLWVISDVIYLYYFLPICFSIILLQDVFTLLLWHEYLTLIHELRILLLEHEITQWMTIDSLWEMGLSLKLFTTKTYLDNRAKNGGQLSGQMIRQPQDWREFILRKIASFIFFFFPSVSHLCIFDYLLLRRIKRWEYITLLLST